MACKARSTPHIGPSAAKAMVPGMQLCGARFAPALPYDVQVVFGRLKRPKKERTLNPIPVIL